MEPYTWLFIASIKKQVLIEWALPLILAGCLKERGISLLWTRYLAKTYCKVK